MKKVKSNYFIYKYFLVASSVLRMTLMVYIFFYGLSYCETRKLHQIHKIMSNSQTSVLFE